MDRRCARPILVLLILLFVPCLAVAQAAADNSAAEKEFLVWARQNLHPVKSLALDAPLSELEPLRGIIGNATYVSYGEGLHMAAEPLEFRNLLFRFLVEKMGFTAIAIESGITEGFEVNNYVLGGPGDLDTVVKNGFTFGFNVLPQEADLVRWMRAYNADPRHTRKVQFYGFDVPGMPGHTKIALNAALEYLHRVDPTAETALRDRIADLLPRMNFSRGSANMPGQYTSFTQAERDRVTAAIADMIALFKMREAAYVAASSEHAYQIAYRNAIAARQVDEFMRRQPVGWTPKSGMSAILDTAAISDRAKADNLRWIKDQLGPTGKILIFAHRDHLSYALNPDQRFSGQMLKMPPVMGTYMKRRYGKQLVTIANFFSDNENCWWKVSRVPSAATGPFEAELATLKSPFFLLDLRTAPPNVKAWWKQLPVLYHAGPSNGPDVGWRFDAIFFSRVVTAAVPCK